MNLRLLSFPLLFVLPSLAAPPRDTLPLSSREWPDAYRLHLQGPAKISFSDSFALDFEHVGPHDIALETPNGKAPILRVWNQNKLVRGPEDVAALMLPNAKDFPDVALDFGTDFTALVRFDAIADGALFSKCQQIGKWSADAKSLSISKGKLVYEIGQLGKMTGGPKVDDGKPHSAILQAEGDTVKLFLDGRVIVKKSPFQRVDQKSHTFKVGRASSIEGGDFSQVSIREVKVWKRALPQSEISLLFQPDATGANTPDFAYRPATLPPPKVQSEGGWVQALERSDHSEIVASWDSKVLKEGEEIYKTNCVICHGAKEQAGSLPTALRFAEGSFKNGADPYSMYSTLTKGFGQMMPQPQYTTAQKYAVIHYIRESFLKPHNRSQYMAISPETLLHLPKGLAKGQAEKIDRSLPPFKQMELGSFLHWTYQVEPGNIAQKGIAIRLDDGPGGVTKGRAWMIYDHDTMRVATATTGDFVDWKGIAFDGSHGTHTSLTGERHFVNPVGPGWSMGDFTDKRVVAKDGKRYGSHFGLKYKGVYRNGNQCVIEAEIYGARILESPSLLESGTNPVFVRTIHGLTPWQSLAMRVAPETINVVMTGDGTLTKENGFWVAKILGCHKARFFISHADMPSLQALAKTITTPIDLGSLIKGGPPQSPQTVTTISVAGKETSAFVADEFPLPIDNPWKSWLRPGGFDFTPDGKSAIVAMWNGDVWRVDGVSEKAPATLTWRRIASGLFQPLGVKFRSNDLFVTCRDQIAKLVDLNADGEIDFIEAFNTDGQVTEHFHEFAMGLQTDSEGNFYYAKSARHALDSVIPHHGTLLKVSADGTKTEIVAYGFRAANGVCVNDDGSFFVTDQEGHWTPKNRINRVVPGQFYGNMYGYGAGKDTSDSAMQKPMVWVTNKKDRSPAELVQIPKNAWGNLGGSLLNLSYGTGRTYLVPHERVGDNWQGAVCELPMPALATGIMRGRFAADGALYTCGMYAWAGNQTDPGGFYRIRHNGKASPLPLAIHAETGCLRIIMSDPVINPTCSMKAWSLHRTEKYGSKHLNERTWPIRNVIHGNDPCTLLLDIPDLAPTDCYELVIGDRMIHGTIHQLKSP